MNPRCYDRVLGSDTRVPIVSPATRGTELGCVSRVSKGCVAETHAISYSSLLRFRVRGVRNGNWRALSRLERGLYNCALLLAKRRQRIVNAKLLAPIKAIISRLLATIRTRIIAIGEARACALYETYARNGVFRWAPEAERWLTDPKAVFYLGVTELFNR